MMSRIFSRLYLTLITHIIFYSATTCAQVPYSRVFDIEEDNLSLVVTVMFKDHLGFLWVGTNSGLYKFMGNHAQKITGDSMQPYVTAIGEDKNYSIWVGCKNGGIISFRNNSIIPFWPQEGLPKVPVTGFYFDRQNRLWFSTAGEGIYMYRDNHLYNFNRKNGLGDNYVYAINSNDGNEIIAATDRGLSFIEMNGQEPSLKIFTARDGLPDNIVRVIAPSDLPGYWWIGMQDKGLCLFDVSKKQIISNFISADWKMGQVNGIADLQEVVWIATEDKGIFCYNKQTHSLARQETGDSLASLKVTGLCEDNEGNVWLAAGNHITRTTGNYLQYYRSVENTIIKNVHAVLSDNNSQLWLATGSRLLCYITGSAPGQQRIFPYNISSGTHHIDITSLYKDEQGFLWIGTMGEGLIRMEIPSGRWRNINEDAVVKNGHILSITGKQKEIWVASLNGISKFDLAESNYQLSPAFAFRNYGKSDGIGSDYVYNLFADSRGRIWFATDGAGVAVMDKNKCSNFYQSGQLKSKVVYAVSENMNGAVWMSTLNDGLYKYDDRGFTNISLRDGLSDLTIHALVVDNSNRLVVVNKKGIDVFHEDKGVTVHLGKETGITSLSPNLNAIAKDASGNIWIGMEGGLARLNTTAQKLSPQVCVIEKIELFHQMVDSAATHLFTYQQNNFTFHVAAVYYSDPERVKYQYQLDGYNSKWETTTDNKINFPLLQPGDYTMKVRAVLSENEEKTTESHYHFVIGQPFWKTWWFLAGASCTLILLIYIFTRNRIKKVRYKEQVKNEKFRLQYDALRNQVNPHFLFNSFNALLTIVEDNPAEAPGFIKQLSSFYRTITSSGGKDIITVAEELAMLNTYLFIQQKRYGNALQAQIDVTETQALQYFIPPLSLQLLAENAVKHNAVSGETPLRLCVGIEEDYLVVRNNINPKIKKEEGEGVGLQNIVNRFRMLTKLPVIYGITDHAFTVKLPLLKQALP